MSAERKMIGKELKELFLLFTALILVCATLAVAKEVGEEAWGGEVIDKIKYKKDMPIGGSVKFINGEFDIGNTIFGLEEGIVVGKNFRIFFTEEGFASIVLLDGGKVKIGDNIFTSKNFKPGTLFRINTKNGNLMEVELETSTQTKLDLPFATMELPSDTVVIAEADPTKIDVYGYGKVFYWIVDKKKIRIHSLNDKVSIFPGIEADVITVSGKKYEVGARSFFRKKEKIDATTVRDGISFSPGSVSEKGVRIKAEKEDTLLVNPEIEDISKLSSQLETNAAQITDTSSSAQSFKEKLWVEFSPDNKIFKLKEKTMLSFHVEKGDGFRATAPIRPGKPSIVKHISNKGVFSVSDGTTVIFLNSRTGRIESKLDSENPLFGKGVLVKGHQIEIISPLGTVTIYHGGFKVEPRPEQKEKVKAPDGNVVYKTVEFEF